MRMAGSPEAKKALDAGLNSLVATYGAVFSNTPTPSPELRFELLWQLGYDLFHSLENWRIPDGNHAKHYDATILDDVQDEVEGFPGRSWLNDSEDSSYKGSDSVPF